MPFDFKKYDVKCAEMNEEELHKEWNHYTRLISGAATSTTVSGLALPFTLGVSAIGVGMAAPAIHNARKKREIIEKHLQSHGTTHSTRKRDVMGSMAFSGTVGVLTLGVGSMGADAVASTGAEHGISAIMNNETVIKIGIHAALDGAAMAGEEAHHSHLKEKEAKKMIASAQQKIQLAQAQGQTQGQAHGQGEKMYGNQHYPPQAVYGAIQVPGSYPTTAPQSAMSEKYDIKYQPDVKYQAPPTPQYTQAPPPYSGPPSAITSPTSSIMSPPPQYNPQLYGPPPAQTSGPMSPTPSVSTVSHYSSQPSQPFSPVSPPAQTPLPAYIAPQPALTFDPQSAAHNLPPFQSHVAAPGFSQLAPSLVWSHVQNQWVSEERAPAANTVTQSQPSVAPNQQPGVAPQEYGYPFPQQPTVDRRASIYAQTPAPASYNYPSPTPAPAAQQIYQVPVTPAAASPQQYTPATSHASTYYPSQASTPAPQPNQTPAHSAYSYPTPAQTPGAPQQYPPSQTPAQNAYAYPTPAHTPGVQQFTQSTPYFPPPPGTQSSQPTSAYSPAPGQQAPTPQYAQVPTPQSYSSPPPSQSNPMSQSAYQPPPVMTPPTEHSTAGQSPYYSQYQYPTQRHYSLPTPAPTPGQEKLEQAWPGPQYETASPHAQQPHHAATWGTPAPAAAVPKKQPLLQGLSDAYGAMVI